MSRTALALVTSSLHSFSFPSGKISTVGFDTYLGSTWVFSHAQPPGPSTIVWDSPLLVRASLSCLPFRVASGSCSCLSRPALLELWCIWTWVAVEISGLWSLALAGRSSPWSKGGWDRQFHLVASSAQRLWCLDAFQGLWRAEVWTTHCSLLGTCHRGQ